MREREIETSYNVMWSAWFKGEYCGCGTCNSPIGIGSTEQQAVNDLVEQDKEQDA